MEEELKVSVRFTGPTDELTGACSVPAKPLSPVLNQADLKCFHRTKRTHVALSRAEAGQVGLESRSEG